MGTSSNTGMEVTSKFCLSSFLTSTDQPPQKLIVSKETTKFENEHQKRLICPQNRNNKRRKKRTELWERSFHTLNYYIISKFANVHYQTLESKKKCQNVWKS
jgi:hypothetical protein